jgi:hypothetical protein
LLSSSGKETPSKEKEGQKALVGNQAVSDELAHSQDALALGRWQS